MTSDSPLRGASCLQSAVRLLVIIFQSVTLVSALWRCESREDEGLAGWLGEAVSNGRGRGAMFGGEQHCGGVCVYMCRLNWWWWLDETGCHRPLVLASWLYKAPVSVLKRHSCR